MVFSSSALRNALRNLTRRRGANERNEPSNESQQVSRGARVPRVTQGNTEHAARRPELAGVGLASRATPVPGTESVVVVVRELVIGSSAQLCGRILPGDVLISVDDKTCENMSTFMNMPQIVLGPLGSEVRFQFRRGDGDETFSVTLQRNMLASNQPTRASVGAQTVTSHLTGQIVEGGQAAPHQSSRATEESTISLLRQLYGKEGQGRRLQPADLAQLECFDCAPRSASAEEEEDEEERLQGGPACAICLDPMRLNDRICVAPCPGQHRFHASCLLQWLQHGAGTCPCDKFDVAKALRQKSRKLQLQRVEMAEKAAAAAIAAAAAAAAGGRSESCESHHSLHAVVAVARPVEQPLSVSG